MEGKYRRIYPCLGGPERCEGRVRDEDWTVWNSFRLDLLAADPGTDEGLALSMLLGLQGGKYDQRDKTMSPGLEGVAWYSRTQ